MPPGDIDSPRTLEQQQRRPLGESSSRNVPPFAMASSSRSVSMTGGKRSASTAIPTNASGPSTSAGGYANDPEASGSGLQFGAGPRKPSKGRHSLNGGRLFSSSNSRSSSRAEAMPSSDASMHSASSAVSHNPSSSRTASSSYSNRSGMSALARANANARRVSMQPGAQLADSGTLPVAKKLTVDSTSFDEWMKMATDNKINPTNTFSIALIDYFHDMSLLRSDSGDGSINFQKASCTLDGCVKVWTSRVDSVVTETGKLLNGLVGDGKGQDDDGDLSGELETDENGNAITGRSKKDKRKRARAKEATLVKNFSAIAVKKLDLEYTVDPLFKKTSADFDEGGAGGLLMNHLGVDDRMRIVFDAGEAPGLPQDTSTEQESTDHSAAYAEGSRETTPLANAIADEGDATPQQQSQPPPSSDLVDITRLQNKLFSLAPPSLLTDSMDPLGDLLQGRQICPTLSNFSFAPDQSDMLFGQEQDFDDDEDNEGTPFDLGQMNAGVTATPWGGNDDPEGAFSFASRNDAGDYDGDDSGVDLFGVPAELDRDADVFGFAGDNNGGGSGGGNMQGMSPGPDGDGAFDMFDGGGDVPDDGFNGGAAMDADGPVHWDPRHGPSRHDLLLAFKGISGNDDGQDGDEDSGAPGSGGLFDYFDQRLMKNWAGPEHWKMRSRLAGFGGIQAQQQQQRAANADGAEGDAADVKKKRAPKEAFVIDFSGDEAAVNVKELFEAPRSSSTTLLPKTKNKAETYLLPEDHHFSSKMLLRLFTKPRAVLNIRTKKGGIRFGGLDLPGFGGGGGVDGGEVDGDFWARQEAARQEAEGEGVDFGAMGGGGGDDGDDGPMPLDTQFYHDGDDEGAFEMASAMPQADPNSAAEVDMADFEEEDLAAQAAALKRVRPEYVNYAKKAKRVDVRRLKENIWKELGLAGVAAQDESGTINDETMATTGEDAEMPEAAPAVEAALDASSAKQFRSVLSGLRKLYPKDKLEEISTSFCFICLLHLANEEGLELKIGDANSMLRKISGAMSTLAEDDEDGESQVGGGGGGKFDDSDDDAGSGDDEDEDDAFGNLKVGRLEYLRIKKDPNAGRSA